MILELVIGGIAIFLMFKLNGVLSTSISVVNKATTTFETAVDAQLIKVDVASAETLAELDVEVDKLNSIITADELRAKLANKTNTNP